MTTLSLSTANPTTANVDALVVGLFAGDTVTVADGDNASDRDSSAGWAALFEAAGASGKVGEVVRIPSPTGVRAGSLVGVGLGKPDDFDAERVRRAAGAASRSLAGVKAVGSVLSARDITAAAEGHLLGAYSFDRYKSTSKDAPAKITLFVDAAGAGPKRTLRRAVVAAEAVALARDLVNTAPNDLPPAAFAERASAAAKTAGLTVQVLDEKALVKGGYGGILGVGAGSTRPPRLVRIEYRPSKATSRKTTVALVGKGICFDSGGLSIKPAQGMENMTSDMGGAAAVTATVIAAAALELPIRVIAYVPLAENMPSGSAYRPGDVLRHYGGKTVHVLNTDAEGRLILADAIARAAEDKPDYLIETSTLTGAQVVALGGRTMGVMGDEAFRDRIAELAREVGEGGWAMPIPEEMREGLDDSLADLANISWDRSGGMLRAAAYLKEFVPDGLPWAHLDVAGPAFNTGKAYGYTAVGGTGVPVRTLLATLADIAAR